MIPTLAFNRKASVWQWSRVQRLTLCILAAAAAVTAYAFRLWSLDKGIIPHDGGWLLYILTHQVGEDTTQGHLFFRFFPALADIYLNRLICWLINLCCWCVFSYGFAVWLRKIVKLRISAFTILGLTCLTMMTSEGTAGTPSLNYNQLIHCFTALALGCMLIGIAVNKLWLFAASGFSLGIVGPFQITSLCLAPVMAITLAIASPTRIVKKLMCAFAGMLASFALFVFVITTPEHVARWWQIGVSSLSDTSDSHAGNGLVDLFIQTVRYFMKIVITMLTLAALPLVLHKIAFLKEHRWIGRLILVILAVWFTVYSLNNIPPVIDPVCHLFRLRAVAWIAVGLCVAVCFTRLSSKVGAVVALLLLTPICVSIGTNVPFLMICCVRYITPLLALVLLLPAYGSRLVGWIPAAIFIYAFWLFIFPRDGKYKNWHPQVLTEQVIPLSELGFNQSVKVDEPSARMFEFYRDNVPTGAEALMHRSKWSTAVLLDLKAIDNNFNVATPWHEVTGIKAREVLDHGRTLYVLSVDSTNLRWQPEEYAPIDSLVRLLGDEGYEVLLKRAPSGDILYTINK